RLWNLPRALGSWDDLPKSLCIDALYSLGTPICLSSIARFRRYGECYEGNAIGAGLGCGGK
ncbi:MAG: hypothetical protein ACK4P1_02795, partial [Aggregatilineales bacterium]